MNKGILFVTGLVLSVMLMSGMVLAETKTMGGSGSGITVPTTATVTVEGWMSLTAYNEPITFPQLRPGLNDQPEETPALNVTIGSETNVRMKVLTHVETNDFVCAGTSCNPLKQLSVENMKCMGQSYPLNKAQITICDDLEGGATCNMAHTLSIPSGQPAGEYSTAVVITGAMTTD